MRGPRERLRDVSPPSEFGSGSVVEGYLCEHVNVASATNESLATKASSREEFLYREHRFEPCLDRGEVPVRCLHLPTGRLDSLQKTLQCIRDGTHRPPLTNLPPGIDTKLRMESAILATICWWLRGIPMFWCSPEVNGKTQNRQCALSISAAKRE